MTAPPIALLDVVALRRPIGRWPAGTEGTVVDLYPEHGAATLDISENVPLEERGGCDAALILDADLADLDLAWRAATGQRVAPAPERIRA